MGRSSEQGLRHDDATPQSLDGVDHEIEPATERREDERGDPMKEKRGLIEQELDNLRTLRDELKVQAHLGRAEVRDLWEQGEKRFRELEAVVDGKRKQAREPLEQIGEAADLLIEEIKNGYDRLRKLI